MRYILLVLGFLLLPFGVFAQDSTAPADSGEFVDFVDSGEFDTVSTSREVTAEITNIVLDEADGDGRHIIFEARSGDEKFRVDSANAYTSGMYYSLKKGQDVILELIHNVDGGDDAYFVDVIRHKALFIIGFLFVLAVLLVGGKRGFLALVGLATTLVVLFWFVFPHILAGWNPVVVTVLGSIVILGVNMHLAHGFNRRSFAAFVSTVLALLLVVFFSEFFVYLAQLSGMASEDNALLYLSAENITLPSGILLAGIILGAVGVLDDIAITQTETVGELRVANADLNDKEIFVRAMRVGRHHIASVVNTLVLAYVGVALPLFLVFYMTSDVNTLRFLNEEIVSEEIVRTLAGTIVLVLLVPLSTWLAIFSNTKGGGHGHGHSVDVPSV